MEVPFVDLSRAHAAVRSKLHDAAVRVIDSCTYIGGEEVRGFERDLAEWLGVAEAVGTGCATFGLFAAVRSLGIGPGDEVLTTVHTAIATAEAISLSGARVVFCDIDPQTFNMDPEDLRDRITERSKAVVVVHLYGQPADLDGVMEIARESGLKVIEDCAQALGARYKGRYVGTLGDVGVFSFFPSKPLGGFGDGGAVIARDTGLLKWIRMFSNHGREEKYVHQFEGINSRLDAIQAALLRVCLPHLEEWNRLRREAAHAYSERLSAIDEVQVPAELPGTEPVYHVYCIVVPDRDDLRRYLKERGVSTGIHYPTPLNLQPAYAHLGQGRGHFPRAEYACGHMLSLPLFPGITSEEIRYVCDCIADYFGRG